MLSKFSVKKPYTVIVAVVLILILGFVSFDKMTVDLLPDMNLPYAMVMTTYPGASPEEVETAVTKPVEQAMSTISNIKNVSSSSRENASTVILEFEQTANMDSATIEIRESLDQISSYWPDTVGNPIIMKLNPTMMPIMVSAISVDGEEPAESTRIIKEDVLPEIESLEGVASVNTFGDVEETIRVTVKTNKVSSVDKSVQNQLDLKFKEAEDAMNQAKSQMESGKSQLEAGKSEAAGQMSEAQKKLSQSEAELSQGKLEVNAKLSELQVAKTVLEQVKAQLDASNQELEKQRQELEDLNAQKGTLEAQYVQILQTIEATGETPELLVAKAAIGGQLALLENYDQTMAVIEQGLAQSAQTREILDQKQAELAAGESQLLQVQEQLNAGTMTLADARAQLSSAQLEAALQMSEASAQLAVGEAEVKNKEAELKSAKEKAKASADVKSMLTADMIQNLLMAQNFNMPAGYVKEEGIDYLIRVGDKIQSLEEMQDLVLVDMEGINPIKLSDIADVERVDNAGEIYAKLNGENGILLQIQKQTGYSTGDVTDRILKRLEQVKTENKNLQAVVLMNQGVYIDMVIGSVLENLLFGAVLAILILLLFLKDIRPTFVIACSIPISILSAIVLMYFSGVTMNVISLSGLALGVGMLVDNSIVVIENIYRMRNEEHASAKEAAIKGAQQVAGAITASTLTTVCVFLPIVFTQGIAKQLFVDMGLTIAYSLLASLVVALTLVPMMSAGTLRKTRQKESKFFVGLQKWYEILLLKALRVKQLVLVGALVLFVGSGLLSLSKGTAFMPEMQSTEISMSIDTPKGTTIEDTAKTADAFTEQLKDIKDIGDIGGMSMGAGMMGSDGTMTNQVEFYCLLAEKRSMSDKELQKAIEKIAKKEQVELNLSMSNMDMSALGSSGISVQIKGRELDKLQSIAKDIAKIVQDVKGTKNVSDGMEEVTEELRIIVDKEKAIAHNMTVAQVYQEIAMKLKEPVSSTKLDTEKASIGIVVKEQSSQEMTREQIKELKLDVKKQDGTTEQVALKDITTFADGVGLQSISRDAQSRYINVTSEIGDNENIGLVSNRVEKALSSYKVPAGYTMEMKGEDETIRDTMIELLKMLGLAVVFMYLIMVAQFQSLRSPFIVMFTIPLAFTGGFLGLWLTDSPVSVIAMIGFVMLSGIIVNNGIVFIDYTNQLTDLGMEQTKALVEAGRTRLRPILMTALTTVLGLSTMAMGVGSGADMVQPMAVVTIGGLIYGTVLTLFVVPCIYALFQKKEKARLREGIEEDPND